MMRNVSAQPGRSRMVPRLKGTAPALTLREPAPADWHQDQPAYAGDPDMDWINLPEPPREPRWGLGETGTTKN